MVCWSGSLCYWFRMPPRRKSGLLIASVALVVIGLYAYVYHDAFRPNEIEITHRVATGPPVRGVSRTNLNLVVTQLVFGLDRKYKLTEVKVTTVGTQQSSTNTAPSWHLISDSNSIPVKVFAYGDHIRGLRPLVRKGRPMPLESNVTYRLLVRAG